LRCGQGELVTNWDDGDVAQAATKSSAATIRKSVLVSFTALS
jgi:hypothetical protein